MNVVIAGGHGQIARRLLADRGDIARGLIRNPDHADGLRAVDAEPVVCDLEADDGVAAAIGGADAVVFAAGAGPGSGAERKQTLDRDGAVKLIDAAQRAGIRRYVMVSARGVRDVDTSGDSGEEGFGAYLRAKAEADAALARSGLDFTIVRPGSLTDDAGTGHVHAADSVGDEESSIAREDVAATLLAVLDQPAHHRADFRARRPPDADRRGARRILKRSPEGVVAGALRPSGELPSVFEAKSPFAVAGSESLAFACSI